MTPTIGRIVHYTFRGEIIPAIITHVWSQVSVNLTVFPDGSLHRAHQPEQHTSVRFGIEEGEWHWPEIVREESTK